MAERNPRDIQANAMWAYMEEDERDLNTLSKVARRVKIELNHTWNLRLLPVQLGQAKMPYVRIAQHWRNSKPLYCPRHTRSDWGGDPDYPCPVCKVADQLNESGDEAIRDIGYRAKCVMRFRFWCVVFDKEDARGKVEEMPWEEIINPYEYEMYRTTWEDYKKYQKWATTGRRGSEPDPSSLGVLDLETGVNLLATHTKRGTRLERTDPSPIFVDFKLTDREIDDAIATIWSRLKKPTIILPTEQQLLNLAAKIEEDAERGTDGDGRARRRRRESDDGDRGSRYRERSSGEDDDPDEEEAEGAGRGGRRSRFSSEEERPASRRAGRSRESASAEEGSAPEGSAPALAGPPRRRAEGEVRPARGAAERQDQEVTDEELDQDQIPGAEMPATAPPPPSRRATPAASATAAPDTAPNIAPPPPSRRATPAAAATAAADTVPDIAPPPPLRRSSAESAAKPEAATDVPTDSTSGRRSGGPPAATGVDDNEDHVPEEARDPAPPIKGHAEEPPPAVAANAPAPAPSRTVAGVPDPELQGRLARLSRRERNQ